MPESSGDSGAHRLVLLACESSGLKNGRVNLGFGTGADDSDRAQHAAEAAQIGGARLHRAAGAATGQNQGGGRGEPVSARKPDSGVSSKFTVRAAERSTALRRCTRGDLDSVFRVQTERVVANDKHGGIKVRSWQIDKSRFRHTLAGCTVTIHERLSGDISIRYGPHLVGSVDKSGERRGNVESRNQASHFPTATAATVPPRKAKVRRLTPPNARGTLFMAEIVQCAFRSRFAKTIGPTWPLRC